MSLDTILQKAPDQIQEKFIKNHFPQGSHILFAGEANDFLFFLMKGKAEVYTLNRDGVMLSLNTYHALSFFGEYEIFDPKSTTASIIAKTPCDIIKLHKKDLFQWMKTDFALTLEILGHFASDVIKSHRMNTNLAQLTIQERVLVSIYSHFTIGNLHALSKQILIQEAYAPLRSVNRAIASLKKEGLIDYSNKQFIIVNKGLLEAAVNQINTL